MASALSLKPCTRLVTMDSLAFHPVRLCPDSMSKCPIGDFASWNNGRILAVLPIPVAAELGREASFYFLSLLYLQGVRIALKSLGKGLREKRLVRELDSMECS